MTTPLSPEELARCREAFEVWCNLQPAPNFSLAPWPQGFRRDDGLYDGPTLVDGEYYAPQTQAAWRGYQAAWSVAQADASSEIRVDSVIGALELLHLAIYHKDPYHELLLRTKDILREVKGATNEN